METVNYKGTEFLGTKENLEQVRTMAIDRNDWFICGFPKSGTTWLSEIMSVLSTDGIKECLETPLYKRVPCLDFSPETRAAVDIKIPEITGAQRLFKCHMFPEMLPAAIWEKSAKIVLIFRNPKAILTSAYNFAKNSPGSGIYTAPWDDFYEKALAGILHYGKISKYFLKWWPFVQKENVLLVSYEGLSYDLQGNVSKIAKFLNKDISDTTLAALTHHVGFAAMKDNLMAKNVPQFFGSSQQQGTIDGWKKLFTVAQNEKYDMIFNDEIQEDNQLRNWLNDNIFCF